MRSAYAKGLAFLVDAFESPYAAMRLEVDGGVIEEDVSANASAGKNWSRHCEGMLLGARYHQTNQARFFRSANVDQMFAVLAVPLSNPRDGAIGAITVVVAC
ncbi:MAG: hypothetical protein AAF961_11260, partial [Planctomycetota bacterium]